MKKAFTMIELIFVIVILGILAAVAIPKFLGVAQQAHEANLKTFVGTLNRKLNIQLW
ncbi:type II secretion system protein [Lebetimonas sp. JH292]|uniref:type II secretion system protein n=1 Tax=Lebetimonas sp. JH292 TaxID=990068 RepID=UPI0004B7674A|nr:type II secretion system protein [Lebetimonas sp. JH292]